MPIAAFLNLLKHQVGTNKEPVVSGKMKVVERMGIVISILRFAIDTEAPSKFKRKI